VFGEGITTFIANPLLGAVNARFGVQPVLPVERLVVAGHAFGDFDATVVDLSGIRAGLGPSVAGVLGADVLGRQPSEIDFAAPALVLGRSAEDFAAAREPGEQDATVPIEDVSGGWFVRARAGPREAFFLVDTGSNVSQVSEALADEIGGVVQTRGRALEATEGQETTLRTLRLDVLALAAGPGESAVGRRDVVVAVGDTSLLGADFFAGMRLRIDAPAERMTLRTREARPPPAARGRTP